MEVRWLNKALKNLDQEAEYIATDDPEAARFVVGRIRTAIALLAENPSLGRPGRIAGTRELIVNKTRYLVPYRVRNNSIEILRIFHTSRKLPKSW
jgi:plasmid stabilization system protein ParE